MGPWQQKKPFSLVAKNFCVQYFSTEDANHFKNPSETNTPSQFYMEVTVYIEINVECDNVHRTVKISMASYVRKALHRFQHILRGGKEYSTHTCAQIQYGQKLQYEYPLDAAEYLSYKETNPVQQVWGTFLYYAISIDNTILPSLSDISSEQSKATQNTEKRVAKLLNYISSNPHA